ncbi:lantibiotic dehydratase [Streptomyces ficellus]|uniref:Lantibiotic dehydratase n=1 Tax=Streptomyces ficellus TaxID=1977088 RepID=A0ABT7ZDF9_9ACTN|nr:lantibiotic dehydratase [Streptomyces ficellus]MDN3297553.1 lantibiotic dehydratase [Streptomyces ficellus]
MADDVTPCVTVLLRVAGMPCDAWTGAADPALFDRIAGHAGTADGHAARARALAERLGERVVPHPLLADTDRGAVLALRRRLHAGTAPGTADLALLDRLPAVPADLADDARALCRAADRAATEEAALRRAVAAGHERAAARGWALARTSPVLRDLLDGAAPGLVADVEQRLAGGESWSGRRLRKRAAYIWRVVGRAAAKTTPRGWAGQLALAPLRTDAPGALLITPGTALGALAAAGTENVHLIRTRPPGPPDLRTADAATLLATAPLHVTEPVREEPGDAAGKIRCYVVDPRAPGRLRQIVLRRTRPLETVLGLLADGPCPLGRLEKTLLGMAAGTGGTKAPDPAVLRGFLQHLLTLGVLQVCTAPRLRRSTWTPPEGVTAHGTLPSPLSPADGDPGGWFLDTYRTLTGAVSTAAADRVQRGLRVAARIAALRDADADDRPLIPAQLPPELAAITAEPRPVSEILADLLPAADGRPRATATPRRYGGWPEPSTPGSGYARLLEWLAARARSGDEQVDVNDALLDALGAPPADEALPAWPLDCLLRPLPGPGGPVAVLETASAAGVLDARFADGLRALYGAGGHGSGPGYGYGYGYGYGNADAHRAFLAAVERRTGVRFVELLVPPLAERAANAVRRPVTTGWWTGDPDPTPYYGPSGAQARYLPLDRITVRRSGGRIVAEADGRRVIPVHHATRAPAPPYDLLVRVLLAAGHPAASCLVRLDGLDGALPGHTRLPRLTAGGELVIAPATWRLDRARLWRSGDDALTKARTLALLRRSAGLPRHAFMRTAAGAKPVPADLDALTAVQVVERLCAQQPGTDLLVEEMLPAPGDLVLRDPLHHGAAVATQLLLRLPYDTGASGAGELAAAAAALLRAAPADVPGDPPAPGGRTTGATIAH